MADLSPSHYLGCFEKRYGEQAIFVSERDSRKAVVSLGDAGWQTLLAVVDGPLPDVLLSETELGWLRAWWWAATATREGGVTTIDHPDTVARLMDQMQAHVPMGASPRRRSSDDCV